jgi:hypothetical protein
LNRPSARKALLAQWTKLLARQLYLLPPENVTQRIISTEHQVNL